MKFVTLAEEAVPAVGLGTWQMDTDTAREAVEMGLELGYRHVDTAQMYDNEAGVGRGIAAADVAREDVFLTTKVNPTHRTVSDIVGSVEQSLDRLEVRHVDLLLIHWPHPLANLETVIRGLDRAREAGYTKHIGVSNFGRDRLERARELADAPIRSSFTLGGHNRTSESIANRRILSSPATVPLQMARSSTTAS